MWKADFISVGTAPGTGRVEGLIYGDDVKTAGKYVHNAKQCICGGMHDRCISEYTGALCECNLPRVLGNRFKKWQKSHDQATRQRRAATVKQKREQMAAQDKWQLGTKVWLTRLWRAELNAAEGIIQGDGNGRVIVQLDHPKGGKTVAVTHDHLSSLPPDNGSQEQVSGSLALAACAAVAVVDSAGHHAKGSAVWLQRLRHMDFNECEALVVGHDGFRVQVRVTQGPQHMLRREIRPRRSNVVRVEKPTTNMARPQPHRKPQPVGTKQPTVPHTGGKDPAADMPHTLPGNLYQVLGVLYLGAKIEEIKRAYEQLSVKVHPDKIAQGEGQGTFQTNREGQGRTVRHRGPKMAQCRHTKRHQAPTTGGKPGQQGSSDTQPRTGGRWAEGQGSQTH